MVLQVGIQDVRTKEMTLQSVTFRGSRLTADIIGRMIGGGAQVKQSAPRAFYGIRKGGKERFVVTEIY